MIGTDGITVAEPGGGAIVLKTGGYTSYAYVVPSTLDAIKIDDFVGTAVKGPPSALVAVELAIIPEDMRAGRVGYYGWDPLPDPTARHSTSTATSMINGVVSNPSSPALGFTDTHMTNGVVSAQNGAAGRTLTVTYVGGTGPFRITVPPDAPIVRYVSADRSAISVGAPVMIKTNPGDQAGLVTVGKGVKPPM